MIEPKIGFRPKLMRITGPHSHSHAEYIKLNHGDIFWFCFAMYMTCISMPIKNSKAAKTLNRNLENIRHLSWKRRVV